jgi:hypothetical protein
MTQTLLVGFVSDYRRHVARRGSACVRSCTRAAAKAHRRTLHGLWSTPQSRAASTTEIVFLSVSDPSRRAPPTAPRLDRGRGPGASPFPLR